MPDNTVHNPINLIHIHTKPADECILRWTSISCARWEGEQLLIFLIGDCNPLPVEGKQAKALWSLLRAGSISIVPDPTNSSK